MLVLFMCISFHIYSQTGTSFFSTLSVRDGLPTNIISSICQDRYGFIWIGTGNGLARYDGYKFNVFQRGRTSQTLPSNEINSVIALDDYVWIGTWEGLCKINIKSFEITRIDLGNKSPVRTLFSSNKKIFWVGTADGLIKYNIAKDSFQRFDVINNQLSHNMVRSIYQEPNGGLWVGTYDGVNYLSTSDSIFTRVDSKDRLPASFSNHLILDIKPVAAKPDSLLWIGTELGLYQLDKSTKTISKFYQDGVAFNNEVIKCIYSDQDQNLWLGTDFGLNVVNLALSKVDTYFHNPKLSYSIANNVIRQIFEDQGGVIWIVTSNGLSRINKFGNFYTYHEITTETESQLIGNQVRSVLTSSSGDYWLATQHGAIQIDPSTGKRTVFDVESSKKRRLLLNNVYALEEDHLGRIWIGTSGGINIWDDKQGQMLNITADEKNGLSSNYIGKFSKSPDGMLWVSAWEGGIYKITGNYTLIDEIKFVPIPTFDMGSEKHVFGVESLWVMEYNELYRVDTGTLAKSHIASFSEAADRKMIYSIFFSENREFWAGTNNGLLHYNPTNNVTKFYPIDTGNDEIITSIIEDDYGIIWTTTSTALQKFYPDQERFEFYPLDNNLPLKSFYYGCTSRTVEGEIIFGGDNGFITFSPKKTVPNSYAPPVFITSLEINNTKINVNENKNGVLLKKDIAFENNIKLNYAERSVSFEFSSLHFWHPSSNIYTYKLEGFDNDWKHASGMRNFAVYSNLPPNNYSFIVKGTNNYGIENDHIAKFSFVVKPPLLLSKGFIFFYIVLIILIIYYSLKFYIGRVRLKNELTIAKLEKKHAEEIEHTKEQFFTNISHELRTPISLILPPIHEIQKKEKLDSHIKNLINLAEKNSLRLLRLVNQILDFNKLENDTLQLRVSSVEMVRFCRDIFILFEDTARRHNIEFKFETDNKDFFVWMDMEKVETVLFNLLSNAFKFTPNGGKISLNIQKVPEDSSFSDGACVLRISDTGIGIPPEEQPKIFERFYQSNKNRSRESGSGIGLTLTSEYINLHHGIVDVESTIGKGTEFTVKLPLGKKHFPLESITNDAPVKLMATRSVHKAVKGSKSYQFNLKSDKPLILVIDDNPDMVEFLKSSLSDTYNIVSAENGEEGLIKANNFMPEVIISDIMMPVMDGLTLCKKVKENPRTSYIGIVLLTAKSLDSQHLEGIRIGADVYLTKPFDVELLEAHLIQLITRKKELEGYFRNELITNQDQAKSENNHDNKFIKQVMDIIEANISNPDLSVEMISNEMAMSSTHLYRKLKLLTDHSAKIIIQKYRLKKASLLLQNHEGNISEIMYQVGYSNLSYFSKCFKGEYGVTPKIFQNKY